MPKYKGFTLIELLLAITILSIIAGIVAFSLTGHQRKARDSERKNDLNQIKKAMESTKNDCHATSYYPYAGGGTANPDQAFNNISAYFVATKLIDDEPLDPTNSGNRIYKLFATSDVVDVCPDASGNVKQLDGVRNYILVTQLEVTNDPTAARSKTSCATAISEVSLGSFDQNLAGLYFICPD